MKKLFILALTALAIGTSSFAASTSATTKATNHFAAAFRQAKEVSWNSNGRFEKVNFVLNNEKLTAFYDVDGDLVGTTKELAFDKLPKAAIESITTKFTFPQYQLKDCIEFTTALNERKYYASFDTQDSRVIVEISQSGRTDIFSETVK